MEPVFRYIPTESGHQLPVYAWFPNGQPVAVVHIVHGMAEHASRYSEFAAFLTNQSIVVYAHDLRAHGKAVPNNSLLGIAEEDWFYKTLKDIHFLNQVLKEKYSSVKLFLMGHSMGSFICQRYVQLHGGAIDGLILSATNGKQDPLMEFGIAVAFAQHKLFGIPYRSKLIDQLSFAKFNQHFKPNRTPNDWLSRDENVVDLYVADACCGFVCSAGFFYYSFKGIKDAFNSTNIKDVPCDIPVYCFGGIEDPVGLFGKGFLELIKRWKSAGVKDISFDLYKDGRHEMLNEINKEEVMRNVSTWIQKKLQ